MRCRFSWIILHFCRVDGRWLQLKKNLSLRGALAQPALSSIFVLAVAVLWGQMMQWRQKFLSLEETQAMRTSQKIGMRVLFSGVSHHN